MAGTSPASATPTTWRCWRAPSTSFKQHAGPARRSSSSTATSPTARPTNRTPAPPTASRWARRKSGSPSGPTAGRRTRSFSCPTASMTTSRQSFGTRGRGAPRSLDGDVRGVQATVPGARRAGLDRMLRRQLPDGWDQDLPSFPADPKGLATRDASGQVLNAVAQQRPWLIGGAADLAPSTKTRLTFDGAGDFSAAELRRPEPALRHPRARHGRHSQRAVALQGAALRLRLPDLQRLRPRRAAAQRADGAAGHLHLHPRLDQRRGGRPHPPAGRAPGLAARHPRADHPAARQTPTRSWRPGGSSCSCRTSPPP